MFIHLVYNEGKVIYFLYIFILIYIYIVLLEKIFHPHPYCQIRGSQSPLYKGGSGGGGGGGGGGVDLNYDSVCNMTSSAVLKENFFVKY